MRRSMRGPLDPQDIPTAGASQVIYPNIPPPPLSVSLELSLSYYYPFFLFQVVSLLMKCIEPVEYKFNKRFVQLEEEDAGNFLKLQLITSFNSSVGAPLTQRSLVENGGALAWWISLVKEVKNFSESTKINPKHKGPHSKAARNIVPHQCKSRHHSFKTTGFKLMLVVAKKLKLEFEDVYGLRADSPDGTWKGITSVHSYEFVFLCFMNAYAKKASRVY